MPSRAANSCAPAAGAPGRTTICNPSRRCASCRPNSWSIRAAPWSSIPDVFAVGDVNELADPRHGRQGGHGARRAKAIMAATIISPRASCCSIAPGSPHWNVRKQFEDMFAGKLDYEDWIILANEPRENIGFLESEWNDFDRLTSEDQAHPQHQAAHAALEDRPADRFHQPHSAGVAFPARERHQIVGQVQAASRSAPGGLLLRAGQGMPRQRHADGSAAQARRWPRTMSATTRSTSSRGWARSMRCSAASGRRRRHCHDLPSSALCGEGDG